MSTRHALDHRTRLSADAAKVGHRRPSRPATLAAALAALAAASLAACRAAPTPADPASVDAATTQALRQTAVETADAVAKLDSAPAPTSALAGTQAAAAATAALTDTAAAVTPSGGASDPAAVEAAAEGRLGRPAVAWFVGADCADCAAVEADWAALAAAEGLRVAFVRVDVADAAAAGLVRRYQVGRAPAWIVFATDGRPVARVNAWPGAEVFAGYVAQAK